MGIKKIVGIYFLLNGTREIVYVGKSTNVSNRIISHKFDEDKIWKYAEWEEAPKDLLDHLEQFYINKYKPIYNVAYNISKPKEKESHIKNLVLAGIVRTKGAIPKTKLTNRYKREILRFLGYNDSD